MLPDKMILIPAYARTYTSKEQVLQAWNEGKDFQSMTGSYTSKTESNMLKNMGYDTIQIRYGKRNEKAIILHI